MVMLHSIYVARNRQISCDISYLVRRGEKGDFFFRFLLQQIVLCYQCDERKNVILLNLPEYPFILTNFATIFSSWIITTNLFITEIYCRLLQRKRLQVFRRLSATINILAPIKDVALKFRQFANFEKLFQLCHLMFVVHGLHENLKLPL